jgi:hypothetical protein
MKRNENQCVVAFMFELFEVSKTKENSHSPHVSFGSTFYVVLFAENLLFSIKVDLRLGWPKSFLCMKRVLGFSLSNHSRTFS